jgi:hypothetical protein
MSRSLRSLRLPVVLVVILASNACMGNPFGPVDDGDAVVPTGTKPIPDYCLDPANEDNPLCPFRH